MSSIRELGRDWQTRVGRRVARRRADLGLTQHVVIGRLDDLGWTLSTGGLSNIERGIGLDIGKLLPLSLSLECTITYLLGLTDQDNSWHPDSKLDLKAVARTTPEYRSGHLTVSPRPVVVPFRRHWPARRSARTRTCESPWRVCPVRSA